METKVELRRHQEASGLRNIGGNLDYDGLSFVPGLLVVSGRRFSSHCFTFRSQDTLSKFLRLYLLKHHLLVSSTYDLLPNYPACQFARIEPDDIYLQHFTLYFMFGHSNKEAESRWQSCEFEMQGQYLTRIITTTTKRRLQPRQ